MSRAESVLKQAAEQRFILGQRDHAIANIARRQYAIFAAQSARASTIIRDRDDGGQIHDGTFCGRIRIVPGHDMLLQAAQQGGETRAAAESDDADSALQRPRPTIG